MADVSGHAPITTEQAAEMLGGVTQSWVRYLLKTGRLRGICDFGRWKVDPASVEEFKRRKGGRPRKVE